MTELSVAEADRGRRPVAIFGIVLTDPSPAAISDLKARIGEMAVVDGHEIGGGGTL